MSTPKTRKLREDALREFEKAHKIWMETPIGGDAGLRAKHNKDMAMQHYDRVVRLDNCRNHNDCDCARGYCFAKSQAEQQDKLDADLNRLAGSNGFVQSTYSFQLCGLMLTLHPGGTYSLEDTTG